MSKPKQSSGTSMTGEIQRENITLRLPTWMLDYIRSTAERSGVPFEDLIKAWIAEKALASRRIPSRPQT